MPRRQAIESATTRGGTGRARTKRGFRRAAPGGDGTAQRRCIAVRLKPDTTYIHRRSTRGTCRLKPALTSPTSAIARCHTRPSFLLELQVRVAFIFKKLNVGLDTA